MDIPNTQLVEIGISVISFFGVVLSILAKVLIDELKSMHKSIDTVGRQLGHAKTEIYKVAATVAACEGCHHPELAKILSPEREDLD